MANPEHEAILRQGVEVWNQWREDENFSIKPDLSRANFSNLDLHGVIFNHTDLRGIDLSRVNLSSSDLRGSILTDAILVEATLSAIRLGGANLRGANITSAILHEADLRGADLSRATLRNADLSNTLLFDAHLIEADLTEAILTYTTLYNSNLSYANLSRANLTGAELRGSDVSETNFNETNLTGANLSGLNLSNINFSYANLIGADLSGATLIETNFNNADISGCRIYGISAWKLKVENLTQSNLIITEEGEPEITVDNLEIAQFVYLLLNNAKLRSVIDTLTTKSVLILGRFTPERKAVLEGIREALRKHGYVPMLFDFEKPANRDLTETVMTLASLARFVIADLSDPNSIPHELMSFAKDLPSVPVQSIFCPTVAHGNPYPMIEHLLRYQHVLPIYRYETADELMAALEEKVIRPAEEKVKAVRPTSGLL